MTSQSTNDASTPPQETPPHLSESAQQLEALLFTAGEPVAKKDLAKLLGEPLEALEQHFTELDAALAGHGVTLVLTDTHVQLATSPTVAEFLAAFEQQEAQTLSRAASETLAIIAYRGPLTRYDVDVLRGVDSRSMIRQLLRRGVIAQQEAADSTAQYDITPEFLLQLGITRREELPKFDELSSTERIEELLNTSKDAV